MRDFVKKTMVIAAGVAAAALVACERAAQPASVAKAPATATERVAMKRVRLADPDAGRALFIDKGCVVCHAVNGVGGKAAPALDAAFGAPAADPLEFAARMWRGAPAMIDMQDAELGYAIDLTAPEIADLAAFAADRAAQHALSEDALPEALRNSLLDVRIWEMEDGMDYLRARRSGLPPADQGIEFPIESLESPSDPE